MPRVTYTATEYTDMILIYGECKGNAALALRTYRERYGDRRNCPTNARIIQLAVQRLRDNKSVVPQHEGVPTRRTKKKDGDCLCESDEIFEEDNYDSDCETKPIMHIEIKPTKISEDEDGLTVKDEYLEEDKTKPVIDIEIEPTKISTISDTVDIKTEIQETPIKIEPIDCEDQIIIKSETTADTSKEDQVGLTVKDEYLEEDNYDTECETKPIMDIDIGPTKISTISDTVGINTEIQEIPS